MTPDVTPENAGWGYSGLRIVELPSAGTFRCDTGEDEVVVVPLAGSATVTADGHRADLAGRQSVFAGPTDVAYVPRDSSLTLTGTPGGRFALATARARRRLPFRHVPLAQVRVELRGAGSCSRQVNNFATPDVLEADRLIACEVLTPGGNWSSYPPHKHDEERPGESVLEEIYYYEVARGGPAYQRVYGTDERPIDILREVRSGDVVLIPHGWHGPSMAAPGYDLYYLNVMAGPGARSWLICDDPAHAWVRDTWVDQVVDPRLPFTPQGGSPTVDGGGR
ncbi:5-deoxy-glucuronate isomerase [Micromonospora sp. KC721]|uniref:5-deoxy-glucuronate isomerase n=1 Tax=Micromonospora sp. KC721 TaxID=2530380 RepID=UPI001046A421|nr:5-deoxy-glucuronate isomerase [Micromonospora sp. KC721]TDB80764.1 5-deoxy-glucuronate isomerase [Micromonospora sp. KC721]